MNEWSLMHGEIIELFNVETDEEVNPKDPYKIDDDKGADSRTYDDCIEENCS